jgi:TetR/AcrR family transcriptional repressor of nem operon
MYADLGYGRGCLLGNFSAELADHSPLIRERLAGLFASWTRDIEDAVRDAQAEGSISSRTNPADLAAFLLDAYEGALLRARVEKSGAPLDRFVTITFARLLA